MKKTKDAVKRQLKEQWEQACNGFLVELLRMWELDAHYGYWIGEETGGVYDYGDGMFTINMDDIIYCVLADVTREQYIEWQEYICDASEFGFDTPNLRSFVRGCPRTPASGTHCHHPLPWWRRSSAAPVSGTYPGPSMVPGPCASATASAESCATPLPKRTTANPPSAP